MTSFGEKAWPDPWTPNAATTGNRRQMLLHDYRVTNGDHIQAGPIAESTSSLVELDQQKDVQLGIRSGIMKTDASVIEILGQLIF
jgi:hypothetical protein